MRLLFLGFVGLLIHGVAGGMEVRQYRISEGEFELVGPSVGKEEEVLVKEPGFESRFFADGGIWYDCAKQVAEVLQQDEFSGEALIDLEKGVLVMKAEEEDHENFAIVVRAKVPKQLSLKTAIYEMPGVVSGMRVVSLEKRSEETGLLGEISLVAVPGAVARGQTAGGELKVETEIHIGANDGIAEAMISIKGKPRGIELEMKSGFSIPLGMPWSFELGSVAGRKSVVVAVTIELLLMDGTQEDTWILKEKGGEFLRERRFRGMKRIEARKQEGEFRKYRVNPNFFTFLIQPTPDDGEGNFDPFAAAPAEMEANQLHRLPVYQGGHKELAKASKVYDVKKFLQENGVGFREDDFAVFSELKRTLYAKLSLVNQELLEGCVISSLPSPPRMIRFDLEQVNDDDVILQKLGGLASPGSVATASIGEDLKVELEAQIDSNDSIVETRFKLAGVGGNLERPSLQTGLILQNGVSTVVQTIVSGERKSWRLTLNIVMVEEVVECYLERSK